MAPMTTSDFRPYFLWRPSLRFFAHAAKAAFLRHHREMEPALRRLLPPDAVILDVGAHRGQFTKLFARLAPSGLVVAVEPGTYARAVLRVALWPNRVGNALVVPAAPAARPVPPTCATHSRSRPSPTCGRSGP